MVRKIGDKWEAECTQCGWTGQAETKKAARELLRVHLGIHRTPLPETGSEESEDISSVSDKWSDLKKPGTEPV